MRVYAGFRFCSINKHHFSPFSSLRPFSFSFSRVLSSREKQAEKSKARPPHGAGANLVCSLLSFYCLSEREESSRSWRERATRSQPGSSFLSGWRSRWPRRDAFPKTFRRYRVSWKPSNRRALAGILPSTVSARRLEPNIDSLPVVLAQTTMYSFDFSRCDNGLKLD